MTMAIERDETWIKHYSSAHEILLVGEGDFSFSACLANKFKSATNIVATTLDSYGALVMKYKQAKANLELLEYLRASVFHGVDATKMKIFPLLQGRKFYRIIYNFPHAGFHQREDHPDLINLHRDLVRGFLMNARHMLYFDGVIHITHKTKNPYNMWGIGELAPKCSLVLVGTVAFRIEDYPGYQNKRGSGRRSDDSFWLGRCKTFKFRIPLQPVSVNRNPPLNSVSSRSKDRPDILGGNLHVDGSNLKPNILQTNFLKSQNSCNPKMTPEAFEKPAAEKGPVAKQAPAEKKPIAGKKLPKEAISVVSDMEKTKKKSETYKTYIFKVLKQCLGL